MRFFINYSQSDLASVTLLVDVLRKMGHQVFFGAGLGVDISQWQTRLQSEIDQSAAFIYALSQNAINDMWCQWEFQYAIQIGKPIIPVLVESTPLPAGLKFEQCVDLTKGFTQKTRIALRDHLKALDIYLSPEHAPSSSTHLSGVPSHAVVHPTEPKHTRFALSEDEKIHRYSILFMTVIGITFIVIVITYIIDQPRLQAEQHIRNARNVIQLVLVPTFYYLPTETGTNPQKSDYQITEYNLAATLQPNNPVIYEERGYYYYKDGNYKAAIADYERLVQIDPKYPFGYARLGALYLEVGEYDKALSATNKALVLNPENIYLYWDRAYTYSRLGEFDKALNDYNYVVTLDPETTKPYSLRGIFYYENGEFDSAIVDFTHAIGISDNDFESFKGRGLTYIELNDFEDALKDLERALRLEPSSGDVCVALAQVYDKLNRYSDALTTYQRCLRLDVKDTQITARIATLQATLTPGK